ncbi:MAG: hypothetical protein M0P49_07585, partial [Bacilli bacterium]|nr:hypothetical protein [Bacilli bacterium]
TGDEGTFSDSIDPSSLLEGFKFIPVTTSDGESFVDRKGVPISGAANDDGGYVSFDVYLRSKSPLPIYLSSASVTSVASSLTLNVPSGEQNGAWDPSTTDIVYDGSDDTTLTTSASNATRFSVLGGTTDKIFDLKDVDGFGERVAPTNPTDPVSNWTWGTDYNRAFEYLNRVSSNDLTGATFADETAATIVTTLPADPGETIATLETAGGATFDGKTWTDSDWYAEKLTVNIWLEGWDADCFDVLFNDTVTINMVFKGQIS